MNSAFHREVVRTELVWVITQPVVVIPYRRFGNHIGSSFKGQEPTKKPPVKNYHYWLCNRAEERSSHMNRNKQTLEFCIYVLLSVTVPNLSHISPFYFLLSYSRSILILSFHICIGIPSVLSRGIKTKFCIHFSFPTQCH